MHVIDSFGGRDYIIIWVLVIISWLTTMSFVARHCLLLVASLSEDDTTNARLMLKKCAMWSRFEKIMFPSQRQQFWTSSNWISFIHTQTDEWRRKFLSAASLMMLDIVSLFLLVHFFKGKKIKLFFYRDDGTRMIDKKSREALEKKI